MSHETRIAALERENSDLKARIDALQLLLPASKPAPPRHEPQVKIMTPPLANVALPTADEFRRLRAIVHERYPVLAPRSDENPDDYAAQFRAAFIRLAHCGRRDKPDTERSLGWWIDDCCQWLREQRVNPSWISGGAFTSAVIAHGDIRFVMNDWPHDFACALQFGGGGHPARDWWKRALAGTLLEPVQLDRPRSVQSPARVVANP